MKDFCCKDCGMDCSFHTSGSDSQITQDVIRHMHNAHDLEVIPAEVMLKMYLAIKIKQPATMLPQKRIAEPMYV